MAKLSTRGGEHIGQHKTASELQPTQLLTQARKNSPVKCRKSHLSREIFWSQDQYMLPSQSCNIVFWQHHKSHDSHTWLQIIPTETHFKMAEPKKQNQKKHILTLRQWWLRKKQKTKKRIIFDQHFVGTGERPQCVVCQTSSNATWEFSSWKQSKTRYWLRNKWTVVNGRIV